MLCKFSIKMLEEFMIKKVIAAILGLGLSLTLQAQSLTERLETCNSIKNSKQRLDCLKISTVAASTPSKTLGVKSQKLEPLSVANAATICERLLDALQAKHDLAVQESAKSTDSELAVTWPPSEGKGVPVCIVNRISRKITSISTDGDLMPASLLADMERDSGFREDMKVGKFEGFVRFAKEALTQSFKDPLDIQFRGVFISGKVLPVLCGEVNGKNSYGAFVGFRRFYATRNALLTAVEPVRDTIVFERMWPTMCGDKVVDIASQ